MNQAPALCVGDVTITAVFEIDAGGILQRGIRDATPEHARDVAWLAPRYADAHGRLKGAVQTFLIRAAGATVLVDTCVGNAKPRPGLPPWDRLQTDFLTRLAGHGVGEADAITVVTTHLHFDHVGWNTTLVDGEWRPTFPRGRYLIAGDEYEYWSGRPDREDPDDLAGFADSVQPVRDAGQLDLVDPDHEVCPGVRLLATPGHTPGHVSVLVESRGQRAIITGDAIHHPSQIAHPEWGIYSDFDPRRARQTRADLLARCADDTTTLIGSHFAAPAAVAIHRDGGEFRA